ncbi:MAG: DNA (cytosine-5-)-methyltransferase, partial [Caulobacteraceae bacterium]|nr:DNA (cytosine-5-)-methyltransferase [Caulobacteraceae bacterium]
MNEPTHLDLFSGIGGFALAAKWNGFRTLAFCDCEPYAQAVLRKHWPKVPCHKDIREVRGDLYAGVTLLTGGFPCQPFSVAGKQRGKDDNRYLWPEMCRVIREARPTWIIGENVAGIVNLALDAVCADLEAEGYEVEPVIIPACAVDAPHRRDRVWILAHARNICGRHGFADGFGGNGERKDEKKIRATAATSASGPGKKPETMADTKSSQTRGLFKQPIQADACSGRHKQDKAACWPVESGICRVSDGIPNRTHRLKSLGNAIVP